MIDVLLFGIIIALIGYIFWLTYEMKLERKQTHEAHQQDKNKLINALIARKPEELRDLTLADKVTPIQPQQPVSTDPDLVPENQLSNEEWEKAIQNQLAEA